MEKNTFHARKRGIHVEKNRSHVEKRGIPMEKTSAPTAKRRVAARIGQAEAWREVSSC